MEGEIDTDFIFDDLEDREAPLNRLTSAVIGAAIEVHRLLGPGHIESTYENALAIEFRLREIPFGRQVVVDVFYKGENVGLDRLDFVIDRQLIVEIKAVDSLAPIHSAQVISYLRVTKYKLALLINFNVRTLKDGIRRIANTAH